MNEADARSAFAQRMEDDHTATPTYHLLVFIVEERFSASDRAASRVHR
jgi:hypothetical protein